MKREKRIIAFDIETSPLPRERIIELAGDFDENSVKTGNLGLEKAMEKIAKAKENFIEDKVDRGALSAEYGFVVAIGIKEGDEERLLFGSEEEMLPKFWTMVLNDYCEGDAFWVGFNSNNFDLPFLLRRSFMVGAKVPSECVPVSRYWDGSFWKDLFDVYKAGDFRATISLDRFCRACGLDGKNGSGKGFGDLFKKDREKALEYCLNDIRITYKLAERIFACLT